jgi:diguanylate cyclase (GGDEF)-like protein
VFENLTVLQNLDIAAGAGRPARTLLRRRRGVPEAVAEALAAIRTVSKQSLHELGALLDVSEAAGRAADEVDLAAVLAEQMRRATRTDAVIVSRWEDGTTVLRRLWSDGVPGGKIPMDVADSPLRRNVLRHGRPAVVHVDTTDPLPEAALLRAMGGQTLVSVPLHAGGRTIGIVDLISIAERRVLDPSVMQTVETMASLGGTGLEKVGLLEQLRKAADMDLVTGVHNHRYLQERLRQEVARSARSHSPFAVLMLDLDKFKPVNDSHGHADGDRVLRNIGAAINAQVRTSDVVARYGGDEFVVLMPDTPPDQAEIVARRVVAGVLDGRHTMTDGAEVSVGISAGLAIYPSDGRTSAQLLQVADAQMYAAKRSGGQQVERSTALPIAVEVEPAPVAV